MVAYNRTDVPIGVGVHGAGLKPPLPVESGTVHLTNWASDFDMARYAGVVELDGVAAIAAEAKRLSDAG